jgi:diguanylate cyclase (GGDEF)-like protein
MEDDWEEKTVVGADAGPAAGPGQKRAQLVVLSGSSVGQLFDLNGEQIIGRGREADIRLQGDGISRQHAKLTVRGGTVRIEDLGSTNGSWVNGVKMRVQELHDGDKIQLGSTTILKFSYHDALDEGFQRQMFESASRDVLTQVYNKRFFTERLQGEFAYAQRHKAALSLILFDLDHFKKVNDTYGHLAGDYVLSRLTRVVMPAIRGEDVFARYGGEEFAILSRSTNPPSASVVSERIRALVENHAFEFEHRRIPMTVSVGLAAMPHPAVSTPEDLIALADKALYEAKRGGRNRVVHAAG